MLEFPCGLISKLFCIAVAGVVGLTASCARPEDDRFQAPSSDPAVACSQEGQALIRTPASAVKRAKMAWSSLYDKNPGARVFAPENIAKFEPYVAVLKDGVWNVRGTSPHGVHGYIPVASLCANDEGATLSSTEVP